MQPAVNLEASRGRGKWQRKVKPSIIREVTAVSEAALSIADADVSGFQPLQNISYGHSI